MGNPTLTLVLKDYDYLAPLACGDVVPEAITLNLIRDTPAALARTVNDASLDGGEMSLSRYLIRLSQGDRAFVGLPAFVYRAFRHRCFFVRRDSGLRDLKQLAGLRVGTNEWPATGNVWTRALLREQNVAIDRVHWYVGPVDNPNAARYSDNLPPYVQPIAADRTLRDLLLAGEIDAIMCPNPPKGFYEPNSPIVRLFADYRRAEQDYNRRTKIYPLQHIIGIRRAVFERDPSAALEFFKALDKSRLLWQERRRAWSEISPWLLTEIEESTALMGYDWQPYGVAPNRHAIQAFCDELVAQNLIAQPLDASAVFAEFERIQQER